MKTKKLVLSGLFLALGLVMPFITGQIPEIGNMLLPMHIPVLLCGYVCGWQYGLIVGAITPLLRGMLFGMPVFLPRGLCMAFELGTYGLSVGLLYQRLKNKRFGIYISLLIALLVGRIVWGFVAKVVYSLIGMDFGISIFMTEAFVNAIPGIAIQLTLVPALIYSLEKANLLDD